jgi:hypothetical protein
VGLRIAWLGEGQGCMCMQQRVHTATRALHSHTVRSPLSPQQPPGGCKSLVPSPQPTLPIVVPTQGQWWSKRSMQLSLTEQWCARGGW